jgi:hypothetical protein
VWGAKDATILSGGAFRASTVYKAMFVLAAKKDFTFDPSVTGKVAGQEVHVTDKSSTGMRFEVTFPQTTKEVDKLTIVSEPSNWTYTAGSKVSLTGLDVRLDFKDGTMRRVSAADFAVNGITMKVNGADFSINQVLTTAHNTHPIVISVGDASTGLTATTDNKFSVGKVPIVLRGGTAQVRIGEMYNGKQVTTITGTTIDLSKLLNYHLFTGLPVDDLPGTAAINGVGARTFSVVGDGEDPGAGNLSGSNLEITQVGTFKIGLSIDDTGDTYGAKITTASATLVVVKGEIVILPKPAVDRTNDFGTTTKSIADLFTFKNRLGADLAVGTDTPPVTYTTTPETLPAADGTFSSPTITAARVATFTGNVSIAGSNAKTMLYGGPLGTPTTSTTTWIVTPIVIASTDHLITITVPALSSAGTPTSKTFSVSPATGIATTSGLIAIWEPIGGSAIGETVAITTGTAYRVYLNLAAAPNYKFEGTYTLTGSNIIAPTVTSRTDTTLAIRGRVDTQTW